MERYSVMNKVIEGGYYVGKVLLNGTWVASTITRRLNPRASVHDAGNLKEWVRAGFVPEDTDDRSDGQKAEDDEMDYF